MTKFDLGRFFSMFATFEAQTFAVANKMKPSLSREN